MPFPPVVAGVPAHVSRRWIGHVTEVTPGETGPPPGGFEAEFPGDEVVGCREGRRNQNGSGLIRYRSFLDPVT
jgi:hypothetical protein